MVERLTKGFKKIKLGGIKLGIGKDDGLRLKALVEKSFVVSGRVGLVDGDKVKIGDMINFVALV